MYIRAVENSLSNLEKGCQRGVLVSQNACVFKYDTITAVILIFFCSDSGSDLNSGSDTNAFILADSSSLILLMYAMRVLKSGIALVILFDDGNSVARAFNFISGSPVDGTDPCKPFDLRTGARGK